VVYKIVSNTLHVISARYFLRKVVIHDENPMYVTILFIPPRKYILSVAVSITVKTHRVLIIFIL